MVRGRETCLRRGALACALALALLLQGAFAPLAALRMQAITTLFGVVCLTNPDGTPADPHDLGSQCDVSCLLRTQGASAPPPAPLLLVRPAQIAEAAAPAPRLGQVAPRSHGPRPQSQRAPPFA